MAFRLIDLFAGAGGLTLGFEKHGFKTVWANDFNVDAVATYNANFGPRCLHGNINDLLQSHEIPQADVVIGGPPCQGFSLLNRNRDDDPRKQLWRPYLEVVRRSGAQVFVMENVPQLLGSDEHNEILCAVEAIGFASDNVVSVKLCAADYGVPQVRWRAFIVGCRTTSPSPFFPPPQTHRSRSEKRISGSELEKWKTVEDAIIDLDPPVGTVPRPGLKTYDLHFGRTPTAVSRERYRTIPDQGMNRFDLQRRRPDLTPACWLRKKSGGTDLFGRLWWDRPALTIRTEFFKPEKGRYLHPEQHRPITHREAARLQSFPDDFQFRGTKTEIARQIGNAVPPKLAEAVAQSVRRILDDAANR